MNVAKEICLELIRGTNFPFNGEDEGLFISATLNGNQQSHKETVRLKPSPDFTELDGVIAFDTSIRHLELHSHQFVEVIFTRNRDNRIEPVGRCRIPIETFENKINEDQNLKEQSFKLNSKHNPPPILICRCSIEDPEPDENENEDLASVEDLELAPSIVSSIPGRPASSIVSSMPGRAPSSIVSSIPGRPGYVGCSDLSLASSIPTRPRDVRPPSPRSMPGRPRERTPSIALSGRPDDCDRSLSIASSSRPTRPAYRAPSVASSIPARPPSGQSSTMPPRNGVFRDVDRPSGNTPYSSVMAQRFRQEPVEEEDEIEILEETFPPVPYSDTPKFAMPLPVDRNYELLELQLQNTERERDLLRKQLAEKEMVNENNLTKISCIERKKEEYFFNFKRLEHERKNISDTSQIKKMRRLESEVAKEKNEKLAAIQREAMMKDELNRLKETIAASNRLDNQHINRYQMDNQQRNRYQINHEETGFDDAEPYEDGASEYSSGWNRTLQDLRSDNEAEDDDSSDDDSGYLELLPPDGIIFSSEDEYTPGVAPQLPENFMEIHGPRDVSLSDDEKASDNGSDGRVSTYTNENGEKIVQRTGETIKINPVIEENQASNNSMDSEMPTEPEIYSVDEDRQAPTNDINKDKSLKAVFGNSFQSKQVKKRKVSGKELPEAEVSENKEETTKNASKTSSTEEFKQVRKRGRPSKKLPEAHTTQKKIKRDKSPKSKAKASVTNTIKTSEKIVKRGKSKSTNKVGNCSNTNQTSETKGNELYRQGYIYEEDDEREREDDLPICKICTLTETSHHCQKCNIPVCNSKECSPYQTLAFRQCTKCYDELYGSSGIYNL